MGVRAKVALVAVALVGVLITAGTAVKFTGGKSEAKAAAAPHVDRGAKVKAAARRMFNAANHDDAAAFCDSLTVQAIGASREDCVRIASQPGSLNGYHVARLYIAPTVVFEGRMARVRVRIEGKWFFFYFRAEADSKWRLVKSECLSCGTPGGVRSADGA